MEPLAKHAHVENNVSDRLLVGAVQYRLNQVRLLSRLFEGVRGEFDGDELPIVLLNFRRVKFDDTRQNMDVIEATGHNGEVFHFSGCAMAAEDGNQRP